MTFELEYEEGISDLDYLEKIFKKVNLEEIVKFNGKAYKRIVPKNNKYMKYPYHFYVLSDDIYNGNVRFNDRDGELVSVGWHHKLEIKQ